jgi:sporulation protein YlmC with PRC-barrel domain
LEGCLISSFRLSETVGKEVYTLEGKYVGRVTDLALDTDARSITAVEMKITGRKGMSGNVVLVPFELVVAVEDIVLVGRKK